MTVDSTPKRPPIVNFGPAQSGPRPTANYGWNIGQDISRTMLVYIQGLFMGSNFQHSFSYDENENRGSRIHIVNPNANIELDKDAYPRIVVERGRVNAMGRGGLNNFASINQNTHEEKKIDLFSCPISIRFYGTYKDIELYSSLVFMSLRFLTKPLKLFTIFKVGNPSMDVLKPFKGDVKPAIFKTSVDAIIYKEGTVTISENHLPDLRSMAFKCSQVFDMTTGKKVIVRIS